MRPLTDVEKDELFPDWSGGKVLIPDGLLVADIEDAALCDLAPAVLAQSIMSLENNVLRGMDAIHVGSAVVLKADVFVSSDKRQCEAAARAGLCVELV